VGNNAEALMRKLKYVAAVSLLAHVTAAAAIFWHTA
jgi:hypothetical protein